MTTAVRPPPAAGPARALTAAGSGPSAAPPSPEGLMTRVPGIMFIPQANPDEPAVAGPGGATGG